MKQYLKVQRDRKKYRHRWGKNRNSSFYDNPFDDEFWKDDVYGDDQEFWDEQEEFWKDVDPEGFYNRRGDHYNSQKNFKEEQEYWKRQYEEAKREYDKAYEELMGSLNKKDVKKKKSHILYIDGNKFKFLYEKNLNKCEYNGKVIFNNRYKNYKNHNFIK